MIKIDNYEVVGWKHAIRGMRNPLNSWEKSDSEYFSCSDSFWCDDNCHLRGTDYCRNSIGGSEVPLIGPNDLDLAKRLANAGPSHAKYRRFIDVYVDVEAPLYWWKEFETYRLTVASNPMDIEMNSCSTMHKIHAKEFTLDDFSCEHLFGEEDMLAYDVRCDMARDDALAAVNVNGEWCYFTPKGYIQMTCNMLNHYRTKYLDTKNKKYWWQMIQLLPSSYNQKRTLKLNYQVLAEMYECRKNHKLDDWVNFCEWIKTLPYSELITGEEDSKNE